ncbi:type IVB secretion system protein IcmH/DotU [Pseudomonas chlororaphis]|nr:type IVB secretion system protein IcmH/DotU [Pseudomonas chlororaphis]
MAFARTVSGSRKNARERVQSGPAAADEHLCALADDLLHEVVLFQRLRRQPDLPALRLRLIARVRTFQQQALACGIEQRIVLRARYALCTLLDEIIASSEWARGAWSRHSLLMTFHQEAEGGEGFFAYLDAAQLKPVEHLALLELMYLCLALGLEGRYRIQREGRSILVLKRAQLYETLRVHRERYPRPSLKIAPPGRWPRRALRWTLCGLLVFLIGLAIAGGYDLQVRSTQQWLGLSGLSSSAVAPPSVPATVPTLAERLAEDIRAGHLTLHDEAGAVRLLLGATQLFAPGGSVIAPGSRATLQRTATVLADWPGRIRIIGHSDDTPVGKGLVSNQQLSLRRARAVLFEMFGEAADPGRVQALGRGASEPRVPNDSADNRARNRRVEIVLEPL